MAHTLMSPARLKKTHWFTYFSRNLFRLTACHCNEPLAKLPVSHKRQSFINGHSSLELFISYLLIVLIDVLATVCNTIEVNIGTETIRPKDESCHQKSSPSARCCHYHAAPWVWCFLNKPLGITITYFATGSGWMSQFGQNFVRKGFCLDSLTHSPGI